MMDTCHFDVGDRVFSPDSDPAVIVGIFSNGKCLVIFDLDQLPIDGAYPVASYHHTLLRYRVEPLACYHN